MTIIEEATMKSIQGIYKKLPDLNSVTLRDLFAMCVMTGTLRSASNTETCTTVRVSNFHFY
jgi:hypothetical protein